MNYQLLAEEVYLELKTAYQHERIDTIKELNTLKEQLVDEVAYSNTETEDLALSLSDMIMEVVDESIYMDPILSELPTVTSNNNISYE